MIDMVFVYYMGYFKVWDRRQLNLTYTHRMSSYQHLNLWPLISYSCWGLTTAKNLKLVPIQIYMCKINTFACQRPCMAIGASIYYNDYIHDLTIYL